MNQKTEKKGLRVRDIATIGIFSAILFVITVLIGAATTLVPTVYMFSIAIIALISGPIYLLIMARVHKTGAVIITCLIVGIIWALLGGISVLAFMVIFGVISELIASKSRYMNFKLLTLTYVFYIVAYYLGALAPIYYWTEFFTQAGGSNAAHGEAIIAAGHTPAAFIGVVVMIVAAIVSAFLARRMLKRHFVKAGIISERVD